jgi:hypothetical protein
MEGSGGVTTMGGNTTASADFSLIENRNRTNYAGAGNKQNPYNTKPALSTEELVDVEVLSISGKYNSLIIAKNLAMDIALFNHYNPNFEATMSSTGNFDLRLPPDKMNLFVANKYAILNESVQALLNGASMPDNKMQYQKGKK